MAYNKLSLLEKITSKCVIENECLVFKGQISAKGYGRIKVEGKLKAAHRVMYAIHNGEIPDGMVVMHKCDNPPCVNINHLLLGTQADNVRDMHLKNRAVFNRGQNHQNCKLSAEQIKTIRARYVPYDRKNSTRAISEDYGVSNETIKQIIQGKHWSSKK